MTIRAWYGNLSKENPDLLRVIHDFNQRPQYWVHPTVLSEVPFAEVVSHLTRHGRHQASSWVNRQLGLHEKETFWDFEDPRKRIALLSHATLEKLARYCGAAQRWSRIASIIGKVQNQEIKAAIGEDAHAFALRRARQMVSQEEASQKLEGRTLVEEILHLGWNTVTAALSGEPDSLLSRFILKLPTDALKSEMDEVPVEVRDSAWQRISRINKEVLTDGELKCFA